LVFSFLFKGVPAWPALLVFLVEVVSNNATFWSTAEFKCWVCFLPVIVLGFELVIVVLAAGVELGLEFVLELVEIWDGS
jgi:hypothetical protein